MQIRVIEPTHDLFTRSFELPGSASWSSCGTTIPGHVSPTFTARPGHAGRSSSPGGPSSRRPRTQAARTIAGCGRNARRDMISAGSSESIPGIGATRRGSTAIMSASLPGSSEPICSSSPSARAPSSVPIRSQSSGPEPGRRVRALADAQAVLDVRPGAHVGEYRQLRSAGHVRAQPHPDPGRAVAAERHRPGGEEEVGGRAVGHRAARLGQAGNLARRQVDGVGEDRPRTEPPGPVVHVEVVVGLGEEPGDLAQLVRVLGQVGLPVRAGLAGERGRLAQHLGAARDREPGREGVLEPTAVATVPPRAQVGRLAEADLEDVIGRQALVVGQPIHHDLADDRPDPVRLSRLERHVEARLEDRPVDHGGGRARRGHRPERHRGDALGGRCVELALEREDVALEPGQEVEPGPNAGVGQLRQVDVEVDHAGQEHERSEIHDRSGVADSPGAAGCRRWPRPDRGDPPGGIDVDRAVGLVAKATVRKRREHPRPEAERRSLGERRGGAHRRDATRPTGRDDDDRG